jgi:dCMP deaminase
VLQAGITKVVYSNSYKDTEGIDFLKSAGIEIIHIDDLEDGE